MSVEIVSLDHRAHILAKPDMYVGSVHPSKSTRWVGSPSEPIHQATVNIADGLLKIIDEVISNATDHYARLITLKAANQVSDIDVSLDSETGVITVKNNGEGLSTVPDASGIYQATRAFSIYMSSGNFKNKSAGAMVGTHGLGVKLTTTMSSWLEVESVDSFSGEKFMQKFSDNLDPAKTSKPKITSFKSAPYTKVTFLPDYARFGGVPKDLAKVLYVRVLSMITFLPKTVKLTYNKVLIPVSMRGLAMFAQKVEGIPSSSGQAFEAVTDKNRYWDVVIYPAESVDKSVTMSFVNGGITKDNGSHVKYMQAKVAAAVIEKAKKKVAKKWHSLKPKAVIDACSWFVYMNIVDPKYPSQAKSIWEGDASLMPSLGEIPASVIDKILAFQPLVDAIESAALLADKQALATTKGKVTAHVDLPAEIFQDANLAGRKGQSGKCMLVLCEGNSAFANAKMAISGIPNGRDIYGAMALKGKPLNVTNATATKISQNDEIVALSKAMGLDPSKKNTYTSADELRYGGIRLLLDFDLDGIGHIAPLVINIFFNMYPKLLKIPGFIQFIVTPVVKVWHAPVKGGPKTATPFYSTTSFKAWEAEGKRKTSDIVKYYKGIATSSGKEMHEYFTSQKRFLTFTLDTKEDDAAMVMRFNDKNADMRKSWLAEYDETDEIDFDKTVKINMKEFIDKGTKPYDIYSLSRAIPSVIDGLKDSQRKIVYGLLKNNAASLAPTAGGMRVAQLASYVSTEAEHHHGETSLQEAITKMGQTFVGANNINLIKPSGQFGSRDTNGDDAGAPRYINAMRSEILEILFNPEDVPILKSQLGESGPIEPKYYLPIIPMILVNGAAGIATAFSTNIPQYHPIDIINYIKNILISGDNKTAEEPAELFPCVRGHTGLIFGDNGKGAKYYSKGIWSWDAKTHTVTVTELPIGISTVKYIDNIRDKKSIEGINKQAGKAGAKAGSTDDAIMDKISDLIVASDMSSIKIKIKLNSTTAALMENYTSAAQTSIAKMLGLWSEPSELRLTNMHALSAKHGGIIKYNTPEEIIDEFVEFRLDGYYDRKDYNLNVMKEKLMFDEAIIKYLKYLADAMTSGKIIDNSDTGHAAFLAREKLPKKEGSYKYLETLPISSVKADNIKDRVKRKDDLILKIKDYEATTPETLWLRELIELENQLPEDLYFPGDRA